MNSHFESELESINSQLRPLHRRKAELERELYIVKSQEWISVNGVTKENVELSDGDDKPYFNTISQFSKWLSQNSTKRFCEWNGRIYFRAEIVAGRMPDSPARMEDVT